MSNKKKEIASLTKNQSFTQVFFIVYSFLFFIIGLLLLFFTEDVSLVTMIGEQAKLTIVVQQFFGSFLLLLSFFLFCVRNLEWNIILNFIKALILVGFINLYLLFLLSDSIILPSIYFIFQIIMQISFFVVLYEQLKNR
tara:strand:+ start:546 stop:962 length:417 start_codon:yes stop_codon:yes gene_type:complete